MKSVALLTLGCLLLAGCDEMSHQPRADEYGESQLFGDGKVMQAPPDGTVARDDPATQAALERQPPLTTALLQRGRERFNIYCTPCHDYAGTGHGTVPARGFPQPPDLHEERLRKAPARYFVDVITSGHGVMYAYADRVSPHDRWAIAAYIRALQNQTVPAASLTPQERAKLEEAGHGG